MENLTVRRHQLRRAGGQISEISSGGPPHIGLTSGMGGPFPHCVQKFSRRPYQETRIRDSAPPASVAALAQQGKPQADELLG